MEHMSDFEIPDEFLGSDGPTRARMCRRLAAEAQDLAERAANPETRDGYFRLKQQWLDLAQEIEKNG